MTKKILIPKQGNIQDALDEDKETSKAYYRFAQSIKTNSTFFY
jgi:hypothetical protein